MAGFFLRSKDPRRKHSDGTGLSRPVMGVDEGMKRMKRKDGTVLPAIPFRSTATIAAVSGALFHAVPVLAQNESGDYGEMIFMQNNCFVCHGQQGVGGIGPAFRNDSFLKLNDYVIGQIIMGRGVMPPFGDKLDDKQIAAVASYIRNSWGNRFGAIRPEQVAQIRHELDMFRVARPSPARTTGSAHRQP